MSHDHPWLPAYNEFLENCLPELKTLGKEIGLSTLQSAQDVMKYYEMLHRSWDPMTYILLERALDAYKKETAHDTHVD